MIPRMTVVLPAPLRPKQLAVLDFDTEVEDDMALAVAHVQALDLEHY